MIWKVILGNSAFPRSIKQATLTDAAMGMHLSDFYNHPSLIIIAKMQTRVIPALSSV